ncbi:MAG: SufD family Fe-S cluster assembly protein [Lachnospiraceae bacterium]|nr:SufD family Fe-S cluster assembly protein [Lachnospiraceae bacterium]
MGETSNGVLVNHLPSPTWNRLGVNRAFVNFETLPEVEKTFEFTIENAEQITIERKSTKEAVLFADSFSQGIRREATVAGKAPIYQKQIFATGMGAQYTDLVEKLVHKTDILTVSENEKLEDAVILRWDFKKDGKAASQQIIHAKKNSSATFLLIQESEREAKGHVAIETKVILEEGAKVNLIKVNMLGEGFVLMDDTAAVINEGADLEFTQMILGGEKTYTGCYADQAGDGAVFNVNTGYMANKEHLIDINYVACERGENCSSKIYVKGSLRDRAFKTFRGTIDFRRGSKNSVGDEQEDVLLLDEGVINKTMPVILTEEEDVDARHGATIGNLSPEVLFYMGSRGIDKHAAEMLITRGHLISIANTIPDEDTVKKINLFIREAFDSNECF